MWKKVKEFFENKSVKLVEVVVMSVASTGLLVGGVSADSMSKIPALCSGVLMAIETIISLVQALTTKKD